MAEKRSPQQHVLTPYQQKLRDPRWQKKRLEVFERDEWACQKCGDEDNTLHIHHRDYMKGRDPWDYPMELLITLCESCHGEETEHRPQAEHDLIQALRGKGLFAKDISELAQGVVSWQFVHLNEVVVTALSWAMRDAETMSVLLEQYFAYLEKIYGGKGKETQP